MGTVAEKKEKLEELMQEEFVLVHLDARADGVSVPESLTESPSLTLKLSYAFQGETIIGDDAVTSYLKFDGSYFECVLPWDAIWGLTSSKQQQAIWPEDLPKEVMLQIAKQQFKALGSKLFGSKDSDSNETEEATGQSDDTDPSATLEEESTDKKDKKSKGSHLRLIK